MELEDLSFPTRNLISKPPSLSQPDFSHISNNNFGALNEDVPIPNCGHSRINRDTNNLETNFATRINPTQPSRSSNIFRIDFPPRVIDLQSMTRRDPNIPNETSSDFNATALPRCFLNSNSTNRINTSQMNHTQVPNMFSSQPRLNPVINSETGPTNSQTTYNSFASNMVQFSTNRNFPQNLMNNASTFSGTPNASMPATNNPRNNAPEFSSFVSQRQSFPTNMQTGRSVHDINYVVISGGNHSMVILREI